MQKRGENWYTINKVYAKNWQHLSQLIGVTKTLAKYANAFQGHDKRPPQQR